jgi:hypothetical protein
MKRSVIGAAVGALVLCVTSACRHHAVTASGPKSSPPVETVQVDQVNTAGWDKAWTNLLNDTEESFTPSLPRLMGVEVELIVGNPGKPDDELTLTIRDAQHQELAMVTQIVKVDDADHVMFLMPNGGVPINPGSVYAIQVRGGPTFGWKYVVGGYEKGEAIFNGRPLLADARSTFLFRTFGGK